MADSRLNALSAEVLMNTAPEARLSGLHVETIYSAPEAQVQSVYGEMLYNAAPSAMIETAYTEVLVSTATGGGFVGWGQPA